MRGLKLVGGSVLANEVDVLVKAPTANLHSQALVTNDKIHALLIPKERDADEAMRCSKCKASSDIVIMVQFPGGQGYDLRLCRDCMSSRAPGNPLKIDMELVEG